MKKLMNKKGFTLIEMLVVIAIIAILVAIIVPTVTSSTKKAKAATDAANLRSVAAEIAIKYLEDTSVDNITGNYNQECKSVENAYVEAYVVNDTIEAYFTDGTTYYNVQNFADVADEGGNIANATKPSVNALYTAKP